MTCVDAAVELDRNEPKLRQINAEHDVSIARAVGLAYRSRTHRYNGKTAMNPISRHKAIIDGDLALYGHIYAVDCNVSFSGRGRQWPLLREGATRKRTASFDRRRRCRCRSTCSSWVHIGCKIAIDLYMTNDDECQSRLRGTHRDKVSG